MSTLIKNARIINPGSNNLSNEKLDIFIVGNKISAVGNFPDRAADDVLDVKGAYCAPGIIDINSTSDRYLTLFEEKNQEDFLMNGITSTIGGQCGVSLAPISINNARLGYNRWMDLQSINLDWNSTKEFLSHLERNKVGVNFGTFTGHSTIRNSFFPKKKKLSKKELDSLLLVVRRSLSEGSLGVSFRMGSEEFSNATPTEMGRLLKLIADHGKIASFHLRDYDEEMDSSLQEVVDLVAKEQNKTLITHMLPLAKGRDSFLRSLEMINSLPEDIDIRFSMDPSRATLIPLAEFLPPWIKDKSMMKITQSIHDGWLASKIARDIQIESPTNIVIVHSPSHPFLIGHSLSDVMKMYDIDNPGQALMALMISTDLRALLRMGNKQDGIIDAIQHPKMLAGSHAASGKNIAHNPSLFSALLESRDNIMSKNIEDVISKLSFEPCNFLGMKNRGQIKEGFYADIIGISTDTPSGSSGENTILFTMVNGRLAMKEGVITGALGGAPLRL